MDCKYKVNIKNIQYNYKIRLAELQEKYKFNLFCTGGKYDDTEIREEIASLEEENEYLNSIVDQLPKVKVEGEYPTLDNTLQAKMKVDLKGNTSQKTTTGKNLFDVNLVTSVTNGTISDEIITTNETSNSTYSVFPYFPNISLPANTYYLSMDIRIKSGTGYFNKINDAITDWPAVSKPPLSTTFQRYVSSHTYTSVTTLDHILIQFISSTNAVYEITNIMLSTSSDTNYEKYTGGNPAPNPDYPQDIQVVTGNNSIRIANNDNTQSQTYPINIGNIELCKIGDYQDYIYKNSGKWYLYKKISKITLSNSDNFILDSYSQRFTKILDTTYEKAGYSNRYIYGGTYQTTGKFEILNNGRLAFSYPDSNIDTVAKLQTYLTTNELYMYLPLSNSTTTEITDSTLISQLEALKEAESYLGQTSISQVNNDAPFIINASALYDLNNLITRVAILETE